MRTNCRKKANSCSAGYECRNCCNTTERDHDVDIMDFVFKMKLTLKVRMIDGFIVALLLSFCNLVDYIFRHLYIYFKMTYLLLK